VYLALAEKNPEILPEFEAEALKDPYSLTEIEPLSDNDPLFVSLRLCEPLGEIEPCDTLLNELIVGLKVPLLDIVAVG
jgi:hypothetical protein